MKKLVLLLLLVCTCATLSWAQSGKRITVTGSVIDGDDKARLDKLPYSYFLYPIVQWW